MLLSCMVTGATAYVMGYYGLSPAWILVPLGTVYYLFSMGPKKKNPSKPELNQTREFATTDEKEVLLEFIKVSKWHFPATSLPHFSLFVSNNPSPSSYLFLTFKLPSFSCSNSILPLV